jgi:dCMP deaminase
MTDNYPFIRSNPNRSSVGHSFDRWTEAYMDTAERFAELSTCNNLKVGAIIVKDHRIISIGFNETPTGFDICCAATNSCPNDTSEDPIYKLTTYEDSAAFKVSMKPNQENIHAETIAIAKCSETEGSELYCTHAPCIECAKLIYASGIWRVFYKNDHGNDDGIMFLKKCGTYVAKYG